MGGRGKRHISKQKDLIPPPESVGTKTREESINMEGGDAKSKRSGGQSFRGPIKGQRYSPKTLGDEWKIRIVFVSCIRWLGK